MLVRKVWQDEASIGLKVPFPLTSKLHVDIQCILIAPKFCRDFPGCKSSDVSKNFPAHNDIKNPHPNPQ